MNTNLLISLSSAIIPSIILLIYFYKQDKYKPEPKKLILKVFFFGILSTVSAIILELFVTILSSYFSAHKIIFFAFQAFIIAALCEEVIKMFVVKITVYKESAFDEITDGIIYTITASLGFACFENVLYVLKGGFSVAILRAFTAIPMHALASGFMGYYIGMAKFASSKKEETNYFWKGLLIAIFVHGSYNFIIFCNKIIGKVTPYIIGVLLITWFIFLRKKIKLALSKDKAAGRV